jgi:hypothetical protein
MYVVCSRFYITMHMLISFPSRPISASVLNNVMQCGCMLCMRRIVALSFSDPYSCISNLKDVGEL